MYFEFVNVVCISYLECVSASLSVQVDLSFGGRAAVGEIYYHVNPWVPLKSSPHHQPDISQTRIVSKVLLILLAWPLNN